MFQLFDKPTEKTFRYKAEKYKSKYYNAIKIQNGGNNAQMHNSANASIHSLQNMMTLVGGDVDTPNDLNEMSD